MLKVDAYATELMKFGHSHEEIRDEIYAQLIKQTTVNPNPYVPPLSLTQTVALSQTSDRVCVVLLSVKCLCGWQLLGLICEAFPPSTAFAPFVLHYLYNNIKVSSAAYAPYCIHTLWNTMHEPLKHLTDFTLEHVRRFRARDMKAGDIRIYFLDGSEMNVTVQPWTR